MARACEFPVSYALFVVTNVWLQVLRLCGIDARQLRTDLKVQERDELIEIFNTEPEKAQVMICSYLVSCAGLNLQRLCRTTIEFEPPPNESVRAQELGRIKRTGSCSPWVRHITLLGKNTFNEKQDSESILKNLPNLLTQLDLAVWGKEGGDEDKDYQLGDFVLHQDKLYPADDPAVRDLKLEVLEPDNLLYHISMQLLGRKPEGDVNRLRKILQDDKHGAYDRYAAKNPLWN